MSGWRDATGRRGCGAGLWLLLAWLMAGVLAGCGGGSGASSSQSGTVSTMLSDPAPCTNQYSHVWVTVNGVEANTSAGSGSAGWVDLAPGLSSAPIQIDLMASPSTECTLGTLGVTSGLPAGTYQQIRLMLVANNATGVTLANGATNACVKASSGGYNCVVLNPATSCTSSADCKTLSLPSEAQTGLKIPPGQLSPGGLTIGAGASVDIDIDFNACASVVQAGSSGNYELKPTLRAFELGTSPLIAGNVYVGKVSGSSVTVPSPSPSPVPNAAVWLEQQPSAPNYAIGTPEPAASATPSVVVEQLIQQAQTDSAGHFEFCPVSAGNYEIVANALALPKGGGVAASTILSGVSVGSGGGPNNLAIPLIPQPAPTSGPAGIAGVVSTDNSTAPGDNVALSGLQPFVAPSPAATVQALIPYLAPSPTPTPGTLPVPPTMETGSSPFNSADCPAIAAFPSSCTGSVHCACFTLALPAGNPVVGVMGSKGTATFTAPGASATPGYAVGAAATVANGSSTDFPCSPSMLVTNPASPVAVTAGVVAAPTPAPLLSFSGCD